MHDNAARPPARPPRWWVAMVLVGGACLALVVVLTIGSLGSTDPDPAEIPVSGD